MKKVIGVAFIIGGAFAIRYLYKKFSEGSKTELPDLEYVDKKRFMTKEAQEKLYYTMKSIEENRHYIAPSQLFKDPESVDKLKQSFIDMGLGSIDPITGKYKPSFALN